MAYFLDNRYVPPRTVTMVSGFDLMDVSVNFVNNHGRLSIEDPETGIRFTTAPIVEYERSGAHIYAKDVSGHVFTNWDVYLDMFEKQIGVLERNEAFAQKTADRMLNGVGRTVVTMDGFNIETSLCFKNDRTNETFHMSPALIKTIVEIGNRPENAHLIDQLRDPGAQDTFRSMVFGNGGQAHEWDYAINQCGLLPKDVREGIHLIVTCDAANINGNAVKPIGDVDGPMQFTIPNLQEFDFTNWCVAIESNRFCFTNMPEVQQKINFEFDKMRNGQDIGDGQDIGIGNR